jgi:hypothetical protein
VKGQPGDVDGTGASARFSLLSNIMSDGAGNLYVTSAGAATIRKIVIATGAVTTLADATGAALTFNEPRGIAGSGSGDLYVSDDATLRKVVIATGAVTLVAGAASQPGSADATGAGARFNRPYAVASDGAGNLYVADSTTAPSGRSSSRPGPSPRSRARQASTATSTGRAPAPASTAVRHRERRGRQHLRRRRYHPEDRRRDR